MAGGLVWAVTPLAAQTNTSVSPTRTKDTRIVSSDQVDQELNDDQANPLDSLRANRTDYPRLSPEVKRRLLEFKRQRDLYLKEQEALIKMFKGATDAERDRIRERLRDRRLEWLERSRSYRQTARERVQDLLRELPKHQEALEAARDSIQDEVRDVRERPRTD